MSLRKKTIYGALWTFSQKFSVQIVNFVVQIVLARILLPEAFGIIAMLQIFMTIGQTLLDNGMASSLIRTKHPDQRDYSTVFYMNLVTSVGIYFLVFFLAPSIAHFFDQPIITSLLRVYALTFVIQAFVTVQSTRLTKELNFKLQMFMQIPSAIIGGAVGVYLASQGFGVWSLVWLNLCTSSIFMIQHWIFSGWRPSLIFDKEKFRYHFSYGYKLTMSGLITNLYSNSYTFIIGKFFSPAQLGFYNQANTLRIYPVRNITSALQTVTFPVFSSIQDDDVKLKSVFTKITSSVFFVVAPIMIFLSISAESVFRLVLTEKWLPSVPFFQILCISSIFYPQSMYNLNVILAKGRSDLHLKLEVLKKGTSSLFLLLIIPYGMWGVVSAQAIGLFLHFFFNALFCGRLIKYSIRSQFMDIGPVFGIALMSAAVTVFVIYFLNSVTSSDFVLISVGGMTYFSLYLLLSKLFKLHILSEIKSIIKASIKGKL